MAFRSALVDRARLISKSDTGEKVNGRTTLKPVTSEWFRVRLFPAQGTESPDTQGGRKRNVKRPQLLADRIDAVGETIEITANDQIEVDSPELGRSVWEVDGDPQIVRKKRAVLGFLANVSRLEDHEWSALGD